MRTSFKTSFFVFTFMVFSFCNTNTSSENVEIKEESLDNNTLILSDPLILYNSEISQAPRTVAINSTSVVVFINVSCVTCIGDLDYSLNGNFKAYIRMKKRYGTF